MARIDPVSSPDVDKILRPSHAGGKRAPQARRSATWAEMRRSWQAYALLAPIFAVLIVFVYYPPILGLIRAFYQWSPGSEAVFTGFNNFQTYFANPEFGREVRNMTLLIFFGVVAHVLAPFAMAELIFSVRSVVAKELYRLLLVIPLLAPGIVVILLWRNIYDPALGPINALFNTVGLGGLARNWLGDQATALYAIAGVGFPWVAGAGTLIYLGGLAQISESVFDACLLDGATGLRRVLLIDWPLVRGQVRLLLILAVIGAVTSFESVLVLTNGGPGFATSVPALTMYHRAFGTGQFGYASAIGLLLFVVAMAVTILINRSVRPYAEEV